MKVKPLFDSVSRPCFVTDPSKADVLIVFDLSNMAHISYHAYRLSYNGFPTGHIYGSLIRIVTICKDYYGKKVCLAFCMDDYFKAPKRIKKLLPEYKANRGKKDFDPVKDVEKLCTFLPGIMVHVKDEEADQAIAALVYRYYKKIDKIVVLSTDEDIWYTKRASNVEIWRKKGIVTKADIQEKYQSPKYIPLHKAVFGDKSDNVPRISLPRKGKPKEKIIAAIREAGGDIRRFLAIVEENQKEEPFSTIWAEKNQLINMFKVVKLRTDWKLIIKKHTFDYEIFNILDACNIKALNQQIHAMFANDF